MGWVCKHFASGARICGVASVPVRSSPRGTNCGPLPATFAHGQYWRLRITGHPRGVAPAICPTAPCGVGLRFREYCSIYLRVVCGRAGGVWGGHSLPPVDLVARHGKKKGPRFNVPYEHKFLNIGVYNCSTGVLKISWGTCSRPCVHPPPNPKRNCDDVCFRRFASSE